MANGTRYTVWGFRVVVRSLIPPVRSRGDHTSVLPFPYSLSLCVYARQDRCHLMQCSLCCALYLCVSVLLYLL